MDINNIWMDMAIREAAQAGEDGEVPVGAVMVYRGSLIAKAHNQVELLKDPTAHAEILAITQAASALGGWRLEETTLYITKEPCPMCAGAIVQARIPSVFWGVDDPKRGGAKSVVNIFSQPALNHQPAWQSGIRETECRTLLQAFFRRRRVENRLDRMQGSKSDS